MNLGKLLAGVAVVGVVAGCASRRNGGTFEVLDRRRPTDAPVAEIAAIDKMTAEELFPHAEVFAEEGIRLPYRLHKPAVCAEKTRYPLVLFLHGAGACGTNNVRQLAHGVMPICRYAMKHGDAFIVAPQCPEGKKWVDVDWSAPTMERPNAPSEQMQAVMSLLKLLKGNYPIDGSRIYVTGLLMGGFGTWDIVWRMPGFFAAMMPVCGGVDTRRPEYYKDSNVHDLGIRFFHGGADTAVSPGYSRRMDKALTDCGIIHSYTEYPGVGHDCWTQTYANEENLYWLFNRHRVVWDVHVTVSPNPKNVIECGELKLKE